MTMCMLLSLGGLFFFNFIAHVNLIINLCVSAFCLLLRTAAIRSVIAKRFLFTDPF